MRHSIIGAVLLVFLNTSTASASLYDIVCVECSPTTITADYEFNNPDLGEIASGDLTITGYSSDFEIDSFFGFPLIAHDATFYWSSGTYSFDSIGDSVVSGQTISMAVNSGQLGMHFLFDWHDNTDIDVLNVFDVSYLNGDMILTSTDVDGNGIVGFAMVDGPFQGTDMATNFVIATPIPAASWLFVSGLIGLINFAGRKKS